MGGRSASRDVNGVYRFGMGVIRAVTTLTTRDDWSGMEHLPRDGGFLVCVNHISHADPLSVARFLYLNGVPGYFLAKDSLFRVPVVGPVLRGSGQIPVYRGSSRANEAYRGAVDALADGRCVAVMPEGTITKDPELWPMRAKSGAARIGLATGRPVIPVAQWGAQFIHHHRASGDWRPRVVSRMRVGPPVPLDDLRGREVDGALLAEATDRILSAITAELEVLRGQSAPPGRWDPLLECRVTGAAASAVADTDSPADSSANPLADPQADHEPGDTGEAEAT